MQSAVSTKVKRFGSFSRRTIIWRVGLASLIVFFGSGLVLDSSASALTSPRTTYVSVGIDRPTAVSSDGTNVWMTNTGSGDGSPGWVGDFNIAGVSITQFNSPAFEDPDGISSDGTDVWVANAQGGTSGTGSVSEIDIASGAITLINNPSFDDPDGISSDGTDVWVANAAGGASATGSVSEIDIATGAVAQINDVSFDDPDGISSDGTDVWVANATGGASSNGSVSEIAVATSAVTQINSSSFVHPTAISSNGTTSWVANEFGGEIKYGSVSKIVNATGVVTQINSTTFDLPLGISANSTDVITANSDGGGPVGSVTIIHIATSTVTSSTDSLLADPVGVSLQGATAWVVSNLGGTSGQGGVTQLTLQRSLQYTITVPFKKDSSTLSKATEKGLLAIEKRIATGSTMNVTGYAKGNAQLARSRALTVVKYLKAHSSVNFQTSIFTITTASANKVVGVISS